MSDTASVEWESPWFPFSGHEQVITASDEANGLLAIAAIHPTALGPALGGTRMSASTQSPNPGWAGQLDVLRGSRAKTSKNALAGAARES